MMKMVFGGIVVIFLFVGGIGVMNIMFVFVIECICEIGICKVFGVICGKVLI